MKIIVADDHALFRDGLRHVLGLLGPDVVVIEADDHTALMICADNHCGSTTQITYTFYITHFISNYLGRPHDYSADQPRFIHLYKERAKQPHPLLSVGRFQFTSYVYTNWLHVKNTLRVNTE